MRFQIRDNTTDYPGRQALVITPDSDPELYEAGHLAGTMERLGIEHTGDSRNGRLVIPLVEINPLEAKK